VDLQLEGKLALVTGGSRGIGKAIARRLADEGCRVAICARGEEALKAAVAELGEGHHGVAADVSTADGARAVVASTLQALGGIDLLVNNVGKSGKRHWSEVDEADFQYSLDINLWSAARVCFDAVPAMRDRGGGSIVMISSVWGREAGGAPGYNIAKAGMISMAKAMARDLAKDNIRVNTIAPGSILFPGGGWDRRLKADPERIERMLDEQLPFGRFGKPEEVADAVAFVSSPRASWISGACIPVDGCQGVSF